MPTTPDPHELAATSATTPGWIPTTHYESRQGNRVRLITLHTSEGATDAVSLGHYFQATVNEVSYHAGWDEAGQVEQYVDYSQASWSILSGNLISDNGAFCCSAVAQRWDRAEWLRHPVMLESAAQWIAARCTARGVPIRRLTVAETAASVRDPNHPGGVIMHRDYTQATGDGTHVDCGDALPWDLLIPRAQQIAGAVT